MKKKKLSAVLSLLAVIWLNGSKATADTASLQELVNGASLNSGLTTYDNFQFLADFGSVSPDISQITVMTLGNGLEFHGNGEFSLDAGVESIIFQLGFNTNTAGSSFRFGGVDLSNGNPMVSGEGLIDLNNKFSASGSTVATAYAIIDPLFGINEPKDTQPFLSPSTQISSVASVTLFADPNSTVSLESFQVTLSVPEPSSIVFLVVCGASMLIRRKRQQ